MKASVEPTAADKASITQRAIESSNVNPVIALAQMIELQRQDAQDAFVISTYKDQTGQQIADLLKPLNV
jgi:flagellar basal body rod protein FlgG